MRRSREECGPKGRGKPLGSHVKGGSVKKVAVKSGISTSSDACEACSDVEGHMCDVICTK